MSSRRTYLGKPHGTNVVALGHSSETCFVIAIVTSFDGSEETTITWTVINETCDSNRSWFIQSDVGWLSFDHARDSNAIAQLVELLFPGGHIIELSDQLAQNRSASGSAFQRKSTRLGSGSLTAHTNTAVHSF